MREVEVAPRAASGHNRPPACVMTIAGSDSGAGAGIQADIKTVSALGLYCTSVITALTAQNTITVTGVQAVTPEFVAQQIDTVLSDIPADAVKVGMVASAEIASAIGAKLREHGISNVVVDPVMVSATGARLLQEDAVQALKQDLIKHAKVVTPNVPEAEALSGTAIRSVADMQATAKLIKALGPQYVCIKGGHLPESDHSVDLLYDGNEFTQFKAKFIDTTGTHGTGCTFAAALAAGLAEGRQVPDAVQRAKEYITTAIATAFPVGKGTGPVNHFGSTYWESC